MTVAATTARTGPYFPNGVTTSFAFYFVAIAASEIEVVSVDGDGVVSTVSSGLYSVTLNVDGTGAVVFSVAPTAAAYPELYIRSTPLLTQDIQLSRGGAFLPEVIARGFDRAAIRDLYLKDLIAHSIAAPRGDTADLALPAAPDRAETVLAFDADGNVLPLAVTALLAEIGTTVTDEGTWTADATAEDEGTWG